MKKCSSHDDLIKEFHILEKTLESSMRKQFDDLRDHFDDRHDKALEAINKNRVDIAVLKTKQIIFAAVAGMGGSQIQEILKRIFF
jgi:tRNA A22 N-methylase